jgi:PAS domain S-box-containing protein
MHADEGDVSGDDSAAPPFAWSDAAGLDFQAVFEAAPGVQLVLAPDSPRFTMLAASDERLAATLSTREATIGRPLFDVFQDANPDNPEASGVAKLRASLETVLRTRAPHRMAVQRYDLQRPDGTWELRYWAPHNVPVLAPDGTVRYILHHVLDITDLVLEREATAAAERREAELRAVLEAMRDGVFLGSADGITLVNHAALEQLGYARREDFARRISALAEDLHIRDARTDAVIPKDEHPFVRALAGERVVRDLLVRHRTTGEDRVLRCVAAPVVVAGAPVAAVAVSTDVTDEVRAWRETEAALVESDRARSDAEAAQARSDAVLRSIADAFYLLDREWRFIYVNDAAEPLLQTTREALLGRTLWEAFPDVAGSPFERPYREAMATGRVTSAEAYFAPLGTWFDVRTYPWAGGLMVHFRDIGARKTAEAERERLLADAEAARREAEAASRAKSEFLAVMSHELRTPLNAIGGYAELIELGIHGPVTREQRAALDRIQRSQRALLSVINEVLNYARLETGAVTYDLADVPVAEVVAAAEVLVAPQLRAKGLVYRWAGCDDGLAVRADRDKLQQVLLNLLSNAIKFTEPRDGAPGHIDVSCAVAPGGGRVLIRVRDTGVGITADKLGSVFEPFVQVDQGLTREHNGTGLGLAISRDLARGMGGDLVAESEVGVGSTFTLTLPAATEAGDRT